MKKEEMEEKLKSIATKYRVEGIKWRTYANPVRGDGLFVGEDMEYDKNDRYGNPIHLPKTKHHLPFQFPHKEAERLVELLNNGV